MPRLTVRLVSVARIAVKMRIVVLSFVCRYNATQKEVTGLRCYINPSGERTDLP
jgi:hypothetical protein